jgi:glycyl-tRNA synthetase
MNTQIPETSAVTMEKIVSLCKRRGFVFASSEIYGGMAGIYDYGHYGFLLKENIKTAWMNQMLYERDDVVALDSAIFMTPKAWVASGHVGGFNDPMIDCKKCNSRFRADHILEEHGIEADKATIEFINIELGKLKIDKKLICSNCKSTDFTEAKVFSLMVKSNLGSVTDEITDDNVTYLRPETCGGIYLNYKNTMDSMHMSLPYGIAQIGKAFRNEIAARQFIFRTREFEQMEMQYFHAPGAALPLYEGWKSFRYNWYLEYGIQPEKIRWYKHVKLAHYASEAYDIEYKYSSMGGFKEVEGFHTRGDWDLTQHAKYSGQKLEYFDEATKEKYTPHILETSVGIARLFLMFIDSAYSEDASNPDEVRTYLALHPKLAPVKVAVLPLLKNKALLTDAAKELFSKLRKEFRAVEYDESGSIGKRYRKQDEIGTPYCVTVDFESVEGDTAGTYTIRDRDTGAQERVSETELFEKIRTALQ